MARRLIQDAVEVVPTSEHIATAKQRVMTFLKTDDPPASKHVRTEQRERRARPLTPLQAAIKDAEIRANSGEWDDAKPAALVGLYALLHRRLYGVDATELNAAFGIARKRVATLLRTQFDDDVDAFAGFIRWTWLREQRRRERQAGKSDFRLGWRLQFSDAYLTDWRVSMTSVRSR